MAGPERRVERDRRRHDRRSSAGRRSSDYRGGFTPITVLMSICGALVVLYIFFVAVGGVDPTEDEAWTIAALILAVLWLAYSWRRLWSGGASPTADRERRGF
jgi:type VI protein secretion system component VasK